ncbi:hypothetical protein KGF54_003919 [Candida jiufengensis]|uniref:uncharacterized protein n=1 Tax=Candida jiufengensis TaxID=497108 RepID=UPI0022251445|nr:uncharacterized protein KGF54_003919 [Candida jiufengensis]KAI5950845.1 hypothetical protein KGF54_003919 [Candida jiufengensis]
MSYISDSEEESIVLNPPLISREVLNGKMSKLSNAQRLNIEKIIKSLCPQSTITTTNLFDVIDDSEEDDDQFQLFEPLSINEEIRHNTDDTEEDVILVENKENEDHLLAYINSKYQDYAPTRTLRKRNFASTHPYLSDQAYYLGLSDISELNTIYEENDHNLESIVKLLNYNYMKLKERYPRDEKYKQKNFYTILGKQSKAAQQLEAEESGEKQPENNNPASDESQNSTFEVPSQISVQGYVASDVDSLNESDDSNNQSDSDDQKESEDDDLYVRVGGRYRKEKSALKGILPESAKHLAIYKSNKQKRKGLRRKDPIEIRKGMAIKKVGRKPKVRENLNDLIDDNVYHEEEAIFNALTSNQSEDVFDLQDELNVSDEGSENWGDDFEELRGNESDIQSIDGHDFDGRSTSPIVISDESSTDFDSEPDDDLDLFSFRSGPTNSDQHLVTDFEGEAYENNAIDRMLTSKARSKNRENKKVKKIINASDRSSTKPTNRTSSRSKVYVSNGLSSKSKSATAKRPSAPKSRRTTSKPRDKSSFKRIDSRPSRPKHSKESYKHSSSKSSSTITPSSKKRKRDTSNQKSIDKYINPGSENTSRAPALATIAFEVESTQPIKSTRYQKYSTNSNVINLSLQPDFAQGTIINEISLLQLHQSADGKAFHKFTDPIRVAYKEHNYCLTLIDMENSIQKVETLLKLMNNEVQRNVLSDKAFKKELYYCIKGLIGWYLLSQSSPTFTEWGLVESLLTNIRESTLILNHNKLFFIPYVVLLQYVMSTMEEINGKVFSRKQNFESSGVFYWNSWFSLFNTTQFENINGSGASSKESESFYIMCTILKLQHCWWSSVTTSVEKIDSSSFNLDHLLEGIFCLSQISKTPSWQPLQVFFTKLTEDKDAGIFYRYIDIIYSMNQFRNWQIEERLILQIHNNIISRKFANLSEEEMDQMVYHQIKSRYDIGGDSFFDRFMQLLWYYISSMSDKTQVKRLITKLYSSHVMSYSNSKDHLVMLTNRFNFIILLTSSSDTDQRNQILNLAESIKDVTNLDIIKAAVKGVTVTTQIAYSKNLKLPLNALQVILTKLNSILYSKPGTKKLWSYFISPINNLIDENVDQAIHFLPLIEYINVYTTIQVNADVVKLSLRIIKPIQAGNLSKSTMKQIRNVNEKSLKFLEHYMMEDSNRNQDLKKDCISLWVITSNLLGNNWDKMILQKFPFIGTEGQRDKYIIYFYTKVLQFFNLRSCKESVISNILRGILSSSPPANLIELIKNLAFANWSCFSFVKWYNFNGLETNKLKFNLLSKLVQQLSNDVNFNFYVSEILKVINKDFSKSDFIVAVVKDLAKYSKLDNKNQSILADLSFKLGLGQLQVQNIPFEEKIVVADINLSRDDEEFETEDLDILYHLMAQEASSLHWSAIIKLVNQFSKALFNYKFDLSNRKLFGFLNLLQNCWKDEVDEDDSQFTALTTICYLFNDINRILFDGYRASKKFKEIFNEFEVYLIYFSETNGLPPNLKEAYDLTFGKSNDQVDDFCLDYTYT